MKKMLATVLFAVLLAGCSSNQELSFEQIKEKDLAKNDQAFYEEAQDKNGVFLFFDTSNDKLVIYFNSTHEDQEQYAVDYSNFELKSDGETLYIMYDMNKVDDTKNSDEQQLYEIQLDKEYKTFELFENGELSAFTSVFS